MIFKNKIKKDFLWDFLRAYSYIRIYPQIGHSECRILLSWNDKRNSIKSVTVQDWWCLRNNLSQMIHPSVAFRRHSDTRARIFPPKAELSQLVLNFCLNGNTRTKKFHFFLLWPSSRFILDFKIQNKYFT